MVIKFLGSFPSHLDVEEVHGIAEGLALEVTLGKLAKVGVEVLDNLVLAYRQHLVTKLLVLFHIPLFHLFLVALLQELIQEVFFDRVDHLSKRGERRGLFLLVWGVLVCSWHLWWSISRKILSIYRLFIYRNGNRRCGL